MYLELLNQLASSLDNKQPRVAITIHQRAMAAMDSTGRGGTMSRAIMWHNLAHILVKLGETAEAERIFHAVLLRSARSDQTGRLDWQPHIHYAEAALTQGHADSAAKYFRAIVAQAVRDSSLYWEGRGLFGLARAQVQLGRLAEVPRVKARIEQILAIHPKLKNTDDQVPDGRVLNGWLKLAAGDTAAAKAHFMEALKSNGYFEGKWRRRLSSVALLAAECALALGQADEALELAREARTIVTLDSLTEIRSANVGAARLIEGRAMVARGDTVEGRTAIARALTALRTGAGPDHPTTRTAATLADRFEGGY